MDATQGVISPLWWNVRDMEGPAKQYPRPNHTKNIFILHLRQLAITESELVTN